MERLLQYWDDLDDFLGIIGLIGERLRTIFLVSCFVSAAFAVQVAGVWLALRHPPLASAFAIILFVTLIYHMATSRHPLK
jgi:membrane protein implicated in regulation of membrane protease activity